MSNRLRPVFDFVLVALLSLAVASLAGCVIGPDGRRVLGPGARATGEAMLEQVLVCGTQAGLAAAVSAASSGGPPSEQVLLDASRCHLDLVRKQIERARERAEPSIEHGRPRDPELEAFERAEPSVEHGRRMLEAQTLEDAGMHEAAKGVARQCDRLARERLEGATAR